jgi:hypothetical protein
MKSAEAPGVLVASKKQAGGKLVRARVTLSGTQIASAQISGDFFLMPPEKLSLVEQFFLAWDVSAPDSQARLARALAAFLVHEAITVSGVSAETIAAVVQQAAQSASSVPGGAQS